MSSGACVVTTTTPPGLGDLALARTLDGQSITSVEIVEAAADAGLVTLMDTGQAIVGTVSSR